MTRGNQSQKKVKGVRRSKQQIVGPRDFDAQRLMNIPLNPPTRNDSPAVTRTLRLVNNYTAVTSAPATFLITYAQLANSDGLDYGIVGPRYQYIRLVRVHGWASNSTGALTATTGGPLEFQLVEITTGSVYSDSLAPGVDYGRVGFRPTLLQRSNWTLATAATTAFSATILSSAAMTTPDVGVITLDVTCDLR